MPLREDNGSPYQESWAQPAALQVARIKKVKMDTPEKIRRAPTVRFHSPNTSGAALAVRRLLLAICALTATASLAACGGDDATAPNLAPTTLARVSGDSQAGVAGTALAQPLAVRVTDAKGNPVAGHSVSWAVTSGGGSVTPAAATTGADGQASVTWTLGTTAGANTATATAAGLPTVTFSATGAAGAAANVALVSGNGQAAVAGTALEQPLVVRVTDAHGNPVAAHGVSWAVVSGGGSVAPTAATTGVNGQVSAAWRLGTKAGANTATATAAGLPAVTFSATGTAPQPPFQGTSFISPNLITASDPTAFESITAKGQGSRVMFDRRVKAFVTVVAHLFDVTFKDGLKSEVQVNPEFNSQSALDLARKYAVEIGRLPAALRADVQTVWIHNGNESFGGGNKNILIHVERAQIHEEKGVLEEILMHEGAHTSLDARHAAAPGWLAAQQADPTFISTYARDYPNREDVAETFGAWLAVRYGKNRVEASVAKAIADAIPNRLLYLDAQNFKLDPFIP